MFPAWPCVGVPARSQSGHSDSCCIRDRETGPHSTCRRMGSQRALGLCLDWLVSTLMSLGLQFLLWQDRELTPMALGQRGKGI